MHPVHSAWYFYVDLFNGAGTRPTRPSNVRVWVIIFWCWPGPTPKLRVPAYGEGRDRAAVLTLRPDPQALIIIKKKISFSIQFWPVEPHVLNSQFLSHLASWLHARRLGFCLPPLLTSTPPQPRPHPNLEAKVPGASRFHYPRRFPSFDQPAVSA